MPFKSISNNYKKLRNRIIENNYNIIDISKELPRDSNYNILHKELNYKEFTLKSHGIGTPLKVKANNFFPETAFLTLYNGKYVILSSVNNKGKINTQSRILDKNNNPITDSRVTSDPWYGQLRLRNLKKIKANSTKYLKNSTLLLSKTHTDNFFHWIIDGIINIYLLELAGLSINDFENIIIPKIDTEWKEALIKKISIPERKLIESDNFSILQCKEFIVPVRHNGINNLPSWIGDGAQKKLALKEDKHYHYPKKIYITREDTVKRNVINEKELLKFLRQIGFVSITLSNKSLIEQQRIFKNAEVVIGPHGAGFTNIFNMKPHSCLIELFPTTKRETTFLELAYQLNIEHYALFFNPIINKKNPNWDHLQIDISILKNFLYEKNLL